MSRDEMADGLNYKSQAEMILQNEDQKSDRT